MYLTKLILQHNNSAFGFIPVNRRTATAKQAYALCDAPHKNPESHVSLSTPATSLGFIRPAQHKPIMRVNISLYLESYLKALFGPAE
jgi:hypothetical protein